eukprot:Colp12_sorted_trinity150504_noHs@21710
MVTGRVGNVQACHIYPKKAKLRFTPTLRTPNINSPTNGLCLRPDIHVDFDNFCVTVEVEEEGPYIFRAVCPSVKESYTELDGKPLQLPVDERNWPDRGLLKWHEGVTRAYCAQYTAFDKGGLDEDMPGDDQNGGGDHVRPQTPETGNSEGRRGDGNDAPRPSLKRPHSGDERSVTASQYVVPESGIKTLWDVRPSQLHLYVDGVL